MPEKKVVDVMWDDSPVDVSAEVNFIWSISVTRQILQLP